MPLINCEIELDLSRSRNYIISKISRTVAVAANLPNPAREETKTNSATFFVCSAKLYAPVVILSINDNIKFLENIKQGFKTIISWNKYRSEITTQSKNNNVDYMIDPTFRNVDRLFVLSFKNGNDDSIRDSFDRYYIPLVKIKDFNALIDNKPFFEQPIKNKQEAYEKLVEMSRNDDYTTGNLLDYSYHQNYYKIISIDLSRQVNTSIPQQINFVWKFGATMLFIAEKQQKTILNFSLDSLNVTE